MKQEWVIEKVKTAIIVVLFLSAILLLYFFWKGFSFDDIKLQFPTVLSDNIVVPMPEEVIKPRDVQVTFGPDNYSLYTANADVLWDRFVQDYISFSESENILVEEISESQWKESMQLKSIRYEFSYPLPLSYLEALGAASISQANGIHSFSIIGYSVASKESIFLCDRENNTYYRMVSDQDYTGLDEEISSLEQQPHSPCYPISMFYGVNNDTLLPYDLQTQLQPLFAQNESMEGGKNLEQSIAEKFFGENLDFIRKITDDDETIVYMYGLGQKILAISPDGKIEYTEEPGNTYTDLSFYDSVVLALKFVASHGNWVSFDGEPLEAYLVHCSAISSDKKQNTLRFTFGLEQNDYALYSQNGPQIIVEVTGSQVTYYRRNIDTAQKALNPGDYALDGQTSPVIEILPASYHILAEILRNTGTEVPGQTADEQFNSVIQQITSVSAGYFEQADENTGEAYFVPAWVIQLNHVDVFFDLYSGVYLGYTNEKMR